MKEYAKHVEYSEELVKELCEELANSHYGVKYLCKTKENWPSERTIYRWLDKYPYFNDCYTRARQRQADIMITDLVEITDDNSNDILINKDGSYYNNSSAVARHRLKIDTIKWIACKLIPKVYGEARQSRNEEDALSEFRVEDK